MEWLTNFIKQIFSRNDMKKLKEKNNINANIETNIKHLNESIGFDNNFSFELRRMANPNINDGNGFGIIKDLKCEDYI